MAVDPPSGMAKLPWLRRWDQSEPFILAGLRSGEPKPPFCLCRSMVDCVLDGRIGLIHGAQQRLRVNEERGGVHALLRRGVRQLDFVAHFLLVVSQLPLEVINLVEAP